MEEAIIPTVLALLGLAIREGSRRLRERRRDRAAARLVLIALRDATADTYEPHMHLMRPVVVPFAAYAEVWSDGRMTLAARMTNEELDTTNSAFAALASLQKSEELGVDLREQVFDDVLDAAGQCEQARRVVWRHTQSSRDRVERWICQRLDALRVRREHWKLGREAVRIRKRVNPPLPARG